MRLLRRSFLSGVCATALFPANYAQAVLFSGGASTGGGGSGTITTLTLNNASGSNETPQWSKCFGHVFTDSDTTGCPLSGGNPTYPIFKISGTTVPYSMSVNPTYWASGRLKHATFVLLLGGNFTINNSTSATVTIYQSSNTSLPTPSSRTTADFSSANLSHAVTFMDGASGSYVASLNTGITDANSDNYVWLDGPAGKMWRIREDYKIGGTPEGYTQNYFYVMSMQDGSGNFGGLRVQSCIATPAGDATFVLRTWKSFSSAQLKTGSTVIRDNVTSGRTNTSTFTYSGSNSVMNASGNVLESFQAVQFTTTGTLPPPLVPGVTYFAYTGQYYNPPQSTFTIYYIPATTFPEGNTGDAQVIITGAGSGTHTFTTYPYVSNQARIFASGTTGEWDFVQGGGSFTPVTTYVDTNIQVQMNNVYWRKTLCVPAYDYTAPVTTGTSTPFYINTNCGLTNNPGSGGIDEHLGPFPTPFVRHLYTQSLTDERNVRAIGLAGGQMPQCVRVAANGYTVPSWNNGHNGSGTPYTGMGSLLTANRWVGFLGSNGNIYQANTSVFLATISGTSLTINSGSITGIVGTNQVLSGPGVVPGTTITSGSGLSWTVSISQTVSSAIKMNGNCACYNSVTEAVPGDNTHSTAYFYYPYLLTGQPEYLDMLIEKGIIVGGRYQGSGPTNTRISTSIYAPYGTAALDGSAEGSRNVAFLGVTRYCIMPLSQSIREDAWILRDIGTLAGIIPKTHPECNAYWQYFNDIVNDNGAWCAAVIANPPTAYAGTAGLFAPSDGVYIEDLWQIAYLNEACAMIYGMTGNSNYLTICNAINKRVAYLVNTFGLNTISNEEFLARQNYTSGEGPLISADNQFGQIADGAAMTWSSSVNPTQFTFNSSGGAYTPSVNDLILFTTPSPPSQTTDPIPAALTAFQGYYIKTVSGSTPNYIITLSATMGGAAITNTDSGSSGIIVWYNPASPFNSLDSNGISDYPTVIYRSALLAQSRGATLDSTANAAMVAVVPGPSSFGTTPTWCFTNSV